MALQRTLPLAALTLLVLASCESGGTGPVDPQVTGIVVTPQSATLSSLGQVLQFSARAVDENGDSIPGVVFTWTSYDERVITVSANRTA